MRKSCKGLTKGSRKEEPKKTAAIQIGALSRIVQEYYSRRMPKDTETCAQQVNQCSRAVYPETVESLIKRRFIL